MITCNKCNISKSEADFSGRHRHCKACMKKAAKEHYRKNKKNYIKYKRSPKGKTSTRKAHLKRTYGITLEAHRLMYVLQNGKCAICKQLVAYDKIDTDHNHKINKVRGLLCHQCNIGLGAFKDSPKNLRNAARYLQK